CVIKAARHWRAAFFMTVTGELSRPHQVVKDSMIASNTGPPDNADMNRIKSTPDGGRIVMCRIAGASQGPSL
ncbi:MAG: hypothetical protein ACRC0H_18185, partial [Aeromonas sobria]